MARIVISARFVVTIFIVIPCAFLLGVLKRECKIDVAGPIYPTISLVTYVDPGYVKKMTYLHEWFLIFTLTRVLKSELTQSAQAAFSEPLEPTWIRY